MQRKIRERDKSMPFKHIKIGGQFSADGLTKDRVANVSDGIKVRLDHRPNDYFEYFEMSDSVLGQLICFAQNKVVFEADFTYVRFNFDVQLPEAVEELTKLGLRLVTVEELFLFEIFLLGETNCPRPEWEFWKAHLMNVNVLAGPQDHPNYTIHRSHQRRTTFCRSFPGRMLWRTNMSAFLCLPIGQSPILAK
ncbi:MAG: hypothetical protein WCF94_02925 [bacterium]